jgi:vacuolar-type H+-ATPase subunit H
MKEVIDNILKEEEKAKNNIDAAIKQAEKIKLEAEQKARDIISTNEKAVKEEIVKKREENEKAFLKRKEVSLKQIKEKQEEWLHNIEKEIPIIANRLFKEIVS